MKRLFSSLGPTCFAGFAGGVNFCGGLVEDLGGFASGGVSKHALVAFELGPRALLGYTLALGCLSDLLAWLRELALVLDHEL